MNSPAPPERTPDRAVMVDVNRTQLRVWEWGDPGSPVVICSHGAYDHGRMLDGIAAALADRGFHVRVPDLRGHGDSGPIDNGHTWDSAVLDLGLLAAEASAPVGLVGHSMGGSMNYNVAGIWPERVAWVVSFDGVGPPPEAFSGAPLAESIPDAVAATMKSLGRGRRVFPDREAMFAQRAGINTRVPELWMRHLVAHGTVENGDGWSWKWHPLFTTWLPSHFEVDVALADIGAMGSPLLLFTGDVDATWTFPKDLLAERLAHFRTAEHVPVPEAGHYLHLERQDFVLDHIDDFLARHGARP